MAEIRLHRMENRCGKGYAAWGGVWPRGQVSPGDGFFLKGEAGKEVPVQSRITAYWPDGSVKWTAHTADAEQMGKAAVLEARAESSASGGMLQRCGGGFRVDTGAASFFVPDAGKDLLREYSAEGRLLASRAELALVLERREGEDETRVARLLPLTGVIEEAAVEEDGPLECVVRLSGTHVERLPETGTHAARLPETGTHAAHLPGTHEDGEGLLRRMPFIVRIRANKGERAIHITHTFLYDGVEKEDFLKGIGIRFFLPVSGKPYNRHVEFLTESGCFHETSALLLTWHPRIPGEVYQKQMEGYRIGVEQLEPAVFADVEKAAGELPLWDEYRLVQESADGFRIRKKTALKDVCLLEALRGHRAAGAVAAGSDSGGLMLARKDFWQKFPSGLEVKGLTGEAAQMTAWFWSPEAESCDFRHYTDTGYNQTYYEGFDEFGASAYGIASTNELAVCGFLPGEEGRLVPDEAALRGFLERVQKPPIFLAPPEYYHEVRAFGFWSLRRTDTPMERWLEEQLDAAADFYQKEIGRRNWYGLFDYGDIMHTYDNVRHCWRYDMGGYAWQNTELVPTLWLWLAFLRTGREDLFAMAEAMSRHCSEVDVYHFGPYKGIGSRHNVRHWGCPCKEARIAMAGHHRFYYYLTGDRRMGDVLEDVKDGDQALLNIDPLRALFPEKTEEFPTHARTGPDWSSFCSDWMTQWERFGDVRYRRKIETGIADIKKAPLKLVSGSDYGYDPASSHLVYIGERATGGTHLSVCMGSPQVWMELAQLLDDPEWEEMIAWFGRFYYLPKEEQQKESGGLIGKREFTFPFMAVAMGAYGAAYYKDPVLAQAVWQVLLRALIAPGQEGGFRPQPLSGNPNGKVTEEIPWISTNFAAQWCLNVVMALEFIREELPENWEDVEELLREVPVEGYFRKA